jgi:hypothetical protein
LFKRKKKKKKKKEKESQRFFAINAKWGWKTRAYKVSGVWLL